MVSWLRGRDAMASWQCFQRENRNTEAITIGFCNSNGMSSATKSTSVLFAQWIDWIQCILTYMQWLYAWFFFFRFCRLFTYVTGRWFMIVCVESTKKHPLIIIMCAWKLEYIGKSVAKSTKHKKNQSQPALVFGIDQNAQQLRQTKQFPFVIAFWPLFTVSPVRTRNEWR